MMNTHTTHPTTSRLLLGLVLSVVLNSALAIAISPAQSPLNIGISAAVPNIMLMVDGSGSMNDDVVISSTVTTPGQMPAGYSYNCSAAISAGAATSTAVTTITNMKINSSNAVKFCTTSTCSKTTGFSPSKCFSNTKYYTVKNYNGATLGTYLGLNLNWYFQTGKFTAATGLVATTTITKKRLDMAKEASVALVDSLIPDITEKTKVRLGLATYNGTNDSGNTYSTTNGFCSTCNNTSGGGLLLTEIADLATDKNTGVNAHGNLIKATINNIKASGYTPLGETLTDIGRYFTTGETGGSLTLHPDTTKVSATLNTIFNNHSIYNSTGNASLATTVVQNYCQKNFVILVSDGLPTHDTHVSSQLSSYITSGTNYSGPLDDVAQALFEMDLRPNMPGRTKATQKSNLTTYAIGFADPSLKTESILKNAAQLGGGKFYFADDSKVLAESFDDIVSDISSKVSSSSSIAANSSKLDNSVAIFQGKFDTGDWTGSFLALPILASEDTNSNGLLDTGEDTNNNGKLDAGDVGTEVWDAAAKIPAPASRKIYTYNPSATPKGVTFTCANLTASQKTALGITSCVSTDKGVWRLDYVRGDATHELTNTLRPTTATADTLRSTDNTVAIFRNRTHLARDTGALLTPDPWVLGDIVNSDAVFVSNENYNYDKLPSTATEGATYKAFVTANATRREMIYVGANDGMLHGFDGTLSVTAGSTPGKEMLAYIPNDIYEGFLNLSDPSYAHQYFVDGSPRVGDAYFNSAWHTVLLGSTGAGGNAVFALDITDPVNFSGSHVLWEVSDRASPTSTDQSTDTSAFRGFGNNMGYALPQGSIVKMHGDTNGDGKDGDGPWAAIVANGYGSANNLAVLYIIDIQTGAIIRAIDTMAGGASTPNGLSTPFAADIDGDKIVDAIYAGDLLGNMWKFDVSSPTASNWKVAYGTTTAPAPLFVACTDNSSPCADANRQPITAKPQVGKAGSIQGAGVMVYFGTGKYFEASDNDVTNAQTQTMYGVWDNGATVARSNLQAQSIVLEVSQQTFDLRVTSKNTVNYPTQKGWYMDMLKPSATSSDGERIISAPLLRNGRIIFVTLIPIPPAGTDVCGAGSDGTSWLMEFDAISGARFADTALGAAFDISGDGKIDAADLVTVPGSSAASGNTPAGGSSVSASGKKSKVGSIKTPGVVGKGKLEYKYTSGSKEGSIEKTPERGSSGSSSTGSRQSWQQLQ